MNVKTAENGGLICIAHWQSKMIVHRDEEFSFSPFGIKYIDGWILMRWCRTTTCNMGHRHVVDVWHNTQASENNSMPLIPKAVWRALKEKVKGVKKEPWPGSGQ